MSKSNPLKKLINLFLNLVFPLSCFGCGKEGFYLCKDCSEKMLAETKFLCPICQKLSFCGQTCANCQQKTCLNGLIYIAPYRNQVLRKMIYAFKYDLVNGLADTLGLLLSQIVSVSELKNLFWPKDNWLLIPIPLHSKKLKERGFNQAELLARKISQETQIPLAEKFLIKIKNTPSQTTLQEKERPKNISEAFSLDDKNLIKDKNIILIDDVTTTGATLEEAAKLLKKNGAKLVWGLVLAKG